MVKKKIFHNSDKDTKIDSIGKVIQYLYYRFSEFYKRTEKTSNSYIEGLMLICLFFTFHFFTILFFLEATSFGRYTNSFISFFYKSDNMSNYGKYILAIGSGIILYGFVYFIVGRKSYQEIYNTYNKESYSQRVKRGRLIVLYIITTFILFAISGYIMEQNRSEEWKKEYRKEMEIPKIQFKLPKKKDTIR
ncbi:hypothetical protein CAPN005_09190 [Capnocytophaga cynodegmi]|nr:hypothetical protein CAPN005_09190 [Capnocytophaga cynodegmi]